MNSLFRRRHAAIIFALTICSPGMAQNPTLSKTDDPKSCQLKPFHFFRAEEKYDYLKNRDCKDDFWTSLKRIELESSNNTHISVGGEIRFGKEFYSNRNWDSDNDRDFWTHRISLHSDINFNENFRVFTQFVHGYSSPGKEVLQFDDLAIQQGFAEYKKDIGNGNLSLRAGRQEVSLGSGRLVSVREGTNVRRSFDALKASYETDDLSATLIYGREVFPSFGAFDNDFDLFKDNSRNPALWGVYSKFSDKILPIGLEAYFLGFESNNARFSDVLGKEKRRTFGLRRVGKIGENFSYNTEAMYQFGKIGENDISAFNIEGDWKYRLSNSDMKPQIGLKFDWSSGDKNNSDGKINTFNPMFVNPSHYSQAKVITPVNIVSIHPSFKFSPTDKSQLGLDYAVFWRANINDGVYAAPRFLLRDASGSQSRDIGQQIGITYDYRINQNLTASIVGGHFWTGSFLKETGQADNIVYAFPRLQFKF